MRWNLTPLERFWSHVDPCRTDGCAVWLAYCDAEGYGRFGPRRAHTFLVGKAPEGLVWDHLCRVRNCVWPEHLEAVTDRVNILRGISFAAREARITHCPQGHPFDMFNTYFRPQGGRKCKACQAAKNTEYMRHYRQKTRLKIS